MIDVKNLHKSFGNHEVLKGVNEHIAEGREGRTSSARPGSGKTTFLRCLNLLEEPTGGEIIFEGVDITAKGYRHRPVHRQKMGMVFQQFNLFPHHDRAREHHAAHRCKLKGMTEESRPTRRRSSCLSACGLAGQGGRAIRHSFPAARSSVSPSCVRWRWSRM